MESFIAPFEFMKYKYVYSFTLISSIIFFCIDTEFIMIILLFCRCPDKIVLWILLLSYIKLILFLKSSIIEVFKFEDSKSSKYESKIFDIPNTFEYNGSNCSDIKLAISEQFDFISIRRDCKVNTSFDV